jgi:hypothetical protein
MRIYLTRNVETSYIVSIVIIIVVIIIIIVIIVIRNGPWTIEK